MIGRRTFCAAGAALLATGCTRAKPAAPPIADATRFGAIRDRLGQGGRLGVAAIETGSGRAIGYDENGRYAMCSTFKVPLAAALLRATDRGALALVDEIPFTQADVLEYAPVVAVHLPRGRLTVERLCAAAIEVSDNSAANLLLPRIGGPAGLTRFMRAAGDSVSRLDRTEPTLNTNLPGDPRDTTSPGAMARLLQALLLGDVLTPTSRERLASWMRQASTGRDRLRAGFPAGWTVGDKTGTGANGAHNDVAIAWPPGRAPLIVASFLSGGTADGTVRNAAHAAVARLIVDALA